MLNTIINIFEKVFKYFQMQMYLTPCLGSGLLHKDNKWDTRVVSRLVRFTRGSDRLLGYIPLNAT